MGAYFNLFKLFNEKTRLSFTAINGTPLIYVFKNKFNSNNPNNVNNSNQQTNNSMILKLFLPDILRKKISDYLNRIKSMEPNKNISITTIQTYPEAEKNQPPESVPNKKVKITIGKDEEGVIYIGLVFIGLDKIQYKEKYLLDSRIIMSIENDEKYNHFDPKQRTKEVANILIDFLSNTYPNVIVSSMEPVPMDSNNNNNNQKPTDNNVQDNENDIPF